MAETYCRGCGLPRVRTAAEHLRLRIPEALGFTNRSTDATKEHDDV